MMKKLVISSAMFLLISMVITLYTRNAMHWLLLLIAIYLYVAYSNECRQIENIWIFILIAISSIPVNIAIMVKVGRYVTFLADGAIGKLLIVVLIYAMLFSVEEIIAGIIGRLIWKKQLSF